MKVAVLGATGYVGQELLRIIHRHPGWRLVAASARQDVGKSLSEWFGRPDWLGQLVPIESVADAEPDLIFNALPAQAATAWVQHYAEMGIRVIDLSADFRFRDQAVYEAAYGPHLAPQALAHSVGGYADDPHMEYAEAKIVGNPGCYPTGFFSLIGPLARAGVVFPRLFVDGKSGVTGAGRSPQVRLLMAEMAENIEPYSVPGMHRHTAEMQAVAGSMVTFQPHLMPMARGMLVTVYWPEPTVSVPDILAVWHDFYRNNPFVDILGSDQRVRTGRVRGTNRVEIMAQADPRGNATVLSAALDNLGKGAAGQAVQHANRWNRWPLTAGLQ